jgi:hypothetical protein
MLLLELCIADSSSGSTAATRLIGTFSASGQTLIYTMLVWALLVEWYDILTLRQGFSPSQRVFDERLYSFVKIGNFLLVQATSSYHARHAAFTGGFAARGMVFLDELEALLQYSKPDFYLVFRGIR